MLQLGDGKVFGFPGAAQDRLADAGAGRAARPYRKQALLGRGRDGSPVLGNGAVDENCQIGVFLAYASRYGQALIDRRPYLPESWTKDHARCEHAAIPVDVEFMTKRKMARAMIEVALDAGFRYAYVLGDAVYGVRQRVARRAGSVLPAYVLAVRRARAGNPTSTGRRW
jgi:SRSO17 transposase